MIEQPDGVVEWSISSFCPSGVCVAVGRYADGRVAVRNTGDPGGPVVEFSRDEWAAFVLGVKNGEFDPAR